MTTFALLKTKRFLPFFLTQFGGAFNDSLVRRGVEMLIVFQGLSGSIPPEIAIFLLLALFMCPFFVFSAFAGHLADVKPKDLLIRYVKIAELVVIGVATYGLITHSLLFSVLAVVGLGVHSAFFGPIKFSLPPQHLEKGELIAANGLIEAGTNVAILFGTVLGSALMGMQGGVIAVAVLAAVAAAVGLIASFAIPAAPPTATPKGKRRGMFSLLRRLFSERQLWLITVGISWFWTLGAILISLFSIITRDLLGAPELCVTAFFAIFSVGVGAGSLFCNRILRGELTATWVPMAALVMAASLFGFYFALPSELVAPTTTLAIFLSLKGVVISSMLFTLSFAAGLFVVPLYGLLQSSTRDEERSQIVAANNILNAIFMVVGSIALTILFKLGMSVSSALLVLAAINLLAALWACFLLPVALLKSVLQLVFKSLFRAEVRGLEKLASVGPRALIVANHLSFLDAVMLAAFLPKRATFAVNTEISRLRWMRPASAFFDLIAIDPTNPMAVRVLIERLKENRHVVIFPEGRITVTGALMKIYEGPALIAEKAGAILVPIRLDGFQFTIFSRVTSILSYKLFPKLLMTILTPRHLQIPRELRGRERRAQLGLALHDLMSELIYRTNQRGPTLLHGIRSAITKVGGSKIIARDPLGGSLSLSALFKRSYLLSRVLKTIIAGQVKIGILLPNGVTLLLFFFACQWRRSTPALLNFSHSAEQIEAACKVSGFKTLITSKKFVGMAKLEEHLEKLRQLGVVVQYVEEASATVSISSKLMALLEFCVSRFRSIIFSHEMIPGQASDAAVVLFTSGSEGTPKGVVLSHANLLHNIDQVTAMIPLMVTDRVFNALPMFHSFGLTGGTLMPIIKGVQVFLYPSPLHYRIIPEIVYNESATILFGTPTFLAGYAKKAHPYDFFSLRYVFSGAERLSESIRDLYQQRFGLRIFEGYGATETSPVISVNSPFYIKAGTVGRLVPGMEHRLDSVPGIDDGGRLFVRGPNIMLGYLKMDKPGVLQPLESDWYDTGDIVSVDALGFITIKGRAKRFAKIGGEMVSLTAVEQALEATWPESLHSLVAIPDPKKGERLILLTTLVGASRESVFEALRQKGIAELAMPRDIRVKKTLPLLGSGKIDVQQVLKLISE